MCDFPFQLMSSFVIALGFLRLHATMTPVYGLSLKMTTAQVVKTSVTVNNNSPIQDYVHPDDQTQPNFEMTPGFKPFTVLVVIKLLTLN